MDDPRIPDVLTAAATLGLELWAVVVIEPADPENTLETLCAADSVGQQEIRVARCPATSPDDLMQMLIAAQEATGVTISTPLGVTSNPWTDGPQFIVTSGESTAIRAAGASYTLNRSFDFPRAGEVSDIT
jgi:hypothetical protein